MRSIRILPVALALLAGLGLPEKSSQGAAGVSAECDAKLSAFRAERGQRLAELDAEKRRIESYLDQYNQEYAALGERKRVIEATIDQTVHAGKPVPEELWDDRARVMRQIVTTGEITITLYDSQKQLAQRSLDLQFSPWSKALLDYDLGVLSECPPE